jgi:hypothetical protein
MLLADICSASMALIEHYVGRFDDSRQFRVRFQFEPVHGIVGDDPIDPVSAFEHDVNGAVDNAAIDGRDLAKPYAGSDRNNSVSDSLSAVQRSAAGEPRVEVKRPATEEPF